jgi:hypothetical protein
MSTTRDILKDREAAVLADRSAAYARHLAPFDNELAEVRRALAAIDAPDVPGLLRIAAGLPPQTDIPYDQWTLKQLAVRALEEHFPYGATANQLLAVFKSAYGRDIPRPSLSPQLSRLWRKDGVIKLEGKLWKLAQPKQKEPSTKVGGSSVGGDGGSAPRSSPVLSSRP